MISLTEAAAGEIKKTIQEGDIPSNALLRITVKGGGCSGFEYNLRFDEETNEGDIVAENHGVRIVTDNKSLLYLDGTILDYFKDIDKRGFVFNNPNATKTCGCGTSFQV